MHHAALAICSAALFTSAAQAQPYSIPWSTIDSGGTTMSNAGYSLQFTVGQPEADEPVVAAPYKLSAGFWPGIFTAPACPADTNGDGILDNGDIGAFVQLFLVQDVAADFNGDGILDNGDIGAFVAAFLAGC